MNKLSTSNLIDRFKTLFTFPKKKGDNQNVIYVWDNKKLIAKYNI